MVQTNEKAVIFTNVKKQYSGNFELNINNLTLMTNTLYCLQGVNGSGKSTLLNILLDIILPDTGKILIHGFNHTSDNAKKTDLLVFEQRQTFRFFNRKRIFLFGRQFLRSYKKTN